MSWVMQQLKKESWNPYVAGALFGVVVALAPIRGISWGRPGASSTWPG